MAGYGQIKSDTEMPAGTIIRRNSADDDFEATTPVGSNLSSGKCRVINCYVVISTGKFVVEYDDTPV